MRCYMRRYVLISLCLMALLPLCGCLGLGTEFRDEQGRALDHPYGDNPPTVTLTFQRHYIGWAVVSVNGGPKIPLPYGRDFPVETRAQKYIRYEIWTAPWVGNDQVLHGEENHVVGLYTGEPIIVDEFLVQGWARLEVVVKNISSQTKTFQNIQGPVFTLRPHEEKIIFIAAGDFVLVWEDRGRVIRGCRNLAPGHKVPWQGRSVDAVFLINDFIPNNNQGMLLDRGGCIRL